MIRSVLRASVAHWRWLVAALIAASGMVAAAEYVAAWKHIPIGALLDDPDWTAHQPFYYGWFELINGLVMAFTAGALSFVGLILAQPERGFLGLAGLLSSCLAADDLLEFHEQAKKFHLTQSAVYVLYAALLSILLLGYRRLVFSTPAAILGCSLLGFLISAKIDGLHPAPAWLPAGFESMCEIFAVCLWAAYWLPAAVDLGRGLSNQCGR